ncbi:unnamed protein product [Camellia sinensis]
MEAWEPLKSLKIMVKMINENDLFKHDWRSRSKVQVLQYIFLKWTLAFLVGLLTGIIATFINLAVENIAGYKHLSMVRYIEEESATTLIVKCFKVYINHDKVDTCESSQCEVSSSTATKIEF